MGRQGSPPPRQRPRMPHHRSRHHRQHNSHSGAQPTGCELPFTLGRLNQESHVPDGNAVVESWLRQVTTTVPTAWPESPETGNQRSKDRHLSPCRLISRDGALPWRPEHIPPAQGALSPYLPPLLNREAGPKRYKRKPGSSSFISLSSPCGELRENDHVGNSPNRRETSRFRSQDNDKVGSAGASSPPSRKVTAPAFEKRPRYKTRADKYDTKKLKDHEKKGKPPDREARQSKGSQPKKRKRPAAGKNVMNHFTSEAVLNDRITIQPNLKPGLFKNKRVSKKHPVTDLSFSSMRLPTYQEHDAQNGRSSSKPSEHRRESREIERVSSFFQPAYADMAPRKARAVKSTSYEESRDERGPPALHQDSLTTLSPSNALRQSQRRSAPVTQETPGSNPAAIPRNPDCRPGSRLSSKGTTYFTWSTSVHSPPARKQSRKQTVDERSESIESARSVTPEDTRMALLTTGVYKGTGIYPYDDSMDQLTHTLEANDESTFTDNNTISHETAYQDQASDQESNMQRRHHSVPGATVALPAHIEERWERILPPEWRLQKSPNPAGPLMDEQESRRVALNITPNVTPVSRQSIAQEALIKPIREVRPAQNASRQENCELVTKANSTTENPVSIPHESDHLTQHGTPGNLDGVTIASRDAMPPPPIPPPQCDSAHPADPKPRNYVSSSIVDRTTGRPLETPLPASHEHPQGTDTCKVKSEPHGPRRETDRVIRNLDSASWIPQAETYTIISSEREKTLSRQGMRSTIYQSQGHDEVPPGASQVIQHTTVPVTESMADFITRIEAELEGAAALNESYQPESVMEAQESFPHPIASIHGMEDQHIASDRSQWDYFQTPVDPVGQLSFTGPPEERNEHEELIAYMEGRPTSLPAKEPKKDIDEFLEMSSFWRPNQFSCF